MVEHNESVIWFRIETINEHNGHETIESVGIIAVPYSYFMHMVEVHNNVYLLSSIVRELAITLFPEITTIIPTRYYNESD